MAMPNKAIQATLCILLLAGTALANIGPQGFHQYRKRVFVETGTFVGDGIQRALDAGFEEIHSVDIDPIAIRDAKNRFKDNSKVNIYTKDSSRELKDILVHIREPVTFWLDAHNGFPDPEAKDVKNTPLLEELEQIKNHPIKTHTILIDDMHCCETLLFDFLTRDQIVAKVLEINPAYRIKFIPGGNEGEYPHNVLVAYIPEESKEL